jgi:hypothetical protein
VALNNDGDEVRLLGPDSAQIDSFVYTRALPDRSFSRTGEGAGEWTDAYPASPGQLNLPPTPTPTATPAATRTAMATTTPTATATSIPAGIVLNELLPDPEFVDWDGNGTAGFADEWIELYNGGSDAATMARRCGSVHGCERRKRHSRAHRENSLIRGGRASRELVRERPPSVRLFASRLSFIWFRRSCDMDLDGVVIVAGSGGPVVERRSSGTFTGRSGDVPLEAEELGDSPDAQAPARP